MSHEVAPADVTDFTRSHHSIPSSPEVATRPQMSRSDPGSPEMVQPSASSRSASSPDTRSQPQQEQDPTQQREHVRLQDLQLDVEHLRVQLQEYPDLTREIRGLGGMDQPQLKLLFLRACLMECPQRRLELWAQLSQSDRRILLDAMRLTGAEFQSCLVSIINTPESDASSTPFRESPQSPMQERRDGRGSREASSSPAQRTCSSPGSAERNRAASTSPGSAERPERNAVVESPLRPHVAAGQWGIPREQSFLHQIEHSELVQHVRVRMPNTISKGQRVQFVHAGKRHEVEVPESAMPGQEILYEVRKWPPIDRSQGYTQRRGWAFTHGIDRQSLTTQLRQTPSMALTNATNWGEMTDQLRAGGEGPMNMQPQEMLRHPFFLTAARLLSPSQRQSHGSSAHIHAGGGSIRDRRPAR